MVSQTADGSTLFGTAQAATADGLTIVRTRGDLLIRLVTSDAITSGFDVGFGMCVVSENAAGVGISAVPRPLDDPAWDGWFVYWTGVVKGLIVDNSASVRINIDSKAMRKIKDTDVVVAVAQGGTEIGAATLNMDLRSRILLKLH